MKQLYHQRYADPIQNTLSIDTFKPLFFVLYETFVQQGYFLQLLDYHGTYGRDGDKKIRREITLRFRDVTIWPLETSSQRWTLDVTLSIVEFLYENSSFLVDYRNEINENGQFENIPYFDEAKGKNEFRLKMNYLLQDLEEGFELKEDGAIYKRAEAEYQLLIDKPVPSTDTVNITSKIEGAKKKYFNRDSTLRKDAVRDLADVLEYIRPMVKKFMSSEENDLFMIANNFSIRHHREKQKTKYDDKIWLSWMFYYYLSTIYAVLNMLERDKLKSY